MDKINNTGDNMQAAFDGLMQLPAIIYKKDNASHEFTFSGDSIACYAKFINKKRVRYWDNLLAEPLNIDDVDMDVIMNFYKRDSFEDEMKEWVGARS